MCTSRICLFNLTTLKILMHILFPFRNLLLVYEALLGRLANFGDINKYIKTGVRTLGLLLRVDTWIYSLILRLKFVIEWECCAYNI